MKIVSVSENLNVEKRIAITPEIAKKYLALGFEIFLSENYGDHLGFYDSEYKELGVKISKDEKEIIDAADIILQLDLPSEDKAFCIKENQTLIGILNPYKNKDKIDNLIKKMLIAFLWNSCPE